MHYAAAVNIKINKIKCSSIDPHPRSETSPDSVTEGSHFDLKSVQLSVKTIKNT